MSMFKNQKLAALALMFSLGCTTAETGLSTEPSESAAAVTPTDQPTAKPTTTAAAVAPLTAPVTGTIGGLPFTGLMNITEFVNEGDQIFGLVTLSNLTGALRQDTLAQLADSRAKVPVRFPGSGNANLLACDILFLQLGPLDLDLLGLVVHLDQVTLDINAEQGPGNLLGNLLCAITGLLDPGIFGQVLGVITNLLNAVLAVLGGL